MCSGQGLIIISSLASYSKKCKVRLVKVTVYSMHLVFIHLITRAYLSIFFTYEIRRT